MTYSSTLKSVVSQKMLKRCYKFAKVMWKQAGYKRKDITVVSCCGDWFVETPKSKTEVSAHCKWCAIAEAISKEVD